LSSAKQATNITQMLECLTLVREFVASFLDDSFNLFHCLLLMELYSLSFFVGCFTYPSAGFSQSRNIFARWSQTPAAESTGTTPAAENEDGGMLAGGSAARQHPKHRL
jgi:hypothetical protein